MLCLSERLEIKQKKNHVNQWLEIKCKEEFNMHIKNMIDSMKFSKRTYYIENEEIIIYNTLGLKSVSVFLKEEASVKTLIKILKEAIEMQEKCINYLIPSECIVFDINHSFIESKSEQLDLIIMPVEIIESIYEFKDWIHDLIKIIDEEKDNNMKTFVDKLYQQINLSNFSLNTLSEFLEREEKKLTNQKHRKIQIDSFAKEDDKTTIGENFENKNFFIPTQDCSVEDGDEKIFNKNLYQSNKKNPFYVELEREDHVNERILHIDKNREAQDFTTHNSQKNKVKKIEKNKLSFNKVERQNKSAYIGIVIFEIVMILALGGMFFYTFKRFSNPKKALAGIFIIWMMINYFVGKEIVKLTKKDGGKKRKNIELKDLEEPKKRIKNKKNKASKKNEEKEIAISDDTAFLQQEQAEALYLKNNENNKVFFLNKKINLVGRKFEDVDVYLNDHSVGRIHALITIENSKIFLQDNNSLNGSYINNERLSKNEKREIRIGDHIGFSRQIFTLISKFS